jgi:cytosine/adenosine deaminase-related metal-dependent hydrolase
MFNQTADVKSWLKNKVNVCLGTDSPMSGGQNLLEEIQFANHIYEKMYGQKLDGRTVFNMITHNPAKAFRIPAGDLSEGAPANFVITRKVVDNPYENILKLKLSDIALVVVNGKPSYGDEKFAPLFKDLKLQHWKVTVENEPKILAVRGSLKLLKKLKNTLGYAKYLPFLPVNTD